MSARGCGIFERDSGGLRGMSFGCEDLKVFDRIFLPISVHSILIQHFHE